MLSTKTPVERELVLNCVVAFHPFVLLLAFFLYVVLSQDFRTNEIHGFDCNPAMYDVLRNYWLYFLVGIPLCGAVSGVGLCFFPTLRLSTLLTYFFCYTLAMACLAFFAAMCLIVTHSVYDYGIFPII